MKNNDAKVLFHSNWRPVHHIYAIDPGPEQSGVCMLSTMPNGVWSANKINNEAIEEFLDEFIPVFTDVVIEGMAFQGRGFGSHSIETCYQIGRFQRLCDSHSTPWCLYSRFEYGRHYVVEGTLNDSTLRAALQDRHGGYAKDEPLYKLKGASDKRSAFALAQYHLYRLQHAGYFDPSMRHLQAAISSL